MSVDSREEEGGSWMIDRGVKSVQWIFLRSIERRFFPERERRKKSREIFLNKLARVLSKLL